MRPKSTENWFWGIAELLNKIQGCFPTLGSAGYLLQIV